jgi:ribosome-binding protein aMBF1 (putative translation factor)
MPFINSESETFDRVLALAGECVDRLFECRYALGWSQSDLAAKLQIAGFDISRSGVSKSKRASRTSMTKRFFT